jgi:hypothetical protein
MLSARACGWCGHGTVRAGGRVAERGSADQCRRALAAIPPSGPEGPPGVPPSYAGRHGHTARASRERRGLAAAQPGSLGCRPQPSMSCAVPQAMGRQPVLDRQPAGERGVVGGLLPAAGPALVLRLVGHDCPVEAQLHRAPAAWAVPRPVRADQMRRTLPEGRVNSLPGTAGDHEATGLPGHAVVSTTTRLPGLPRTGSYRPSQAGRNTRRAKLLRR